MMPIDFGDFRKPEEMTPSEIRDLVKRYHELEASLLERESQARDSGYLAACADLEAIAAAAAIDPWDGRRVRVAISQHAAKVREGRRG